MSSPPAPATMTAAPAPTPTPAVTEPPLTSHFLQKDPDFFLEELVEEDRHLLDYHTMWSDPRSTVWSSQKPKNSLAETRAWLRRWKNSAAPGIHNYAIMLRPESKLNPTNPTSKFWPPPPIPSEEVPSPESQDGKQAAGGTAAEESLAHRGETHSEVQHEMQRPYLIGVVGILRPGSAGGPPSKKVTEALQGSNGGDASAESTVTEASTGAGSNSGTTTGSVSAPAPSILPAPSESRESAPEIGYMLHHTHWNLGLAKRAVGIFLEFYWNVLSPPPTTTTPIKSLASSPADAVPSPHPPMSPTKADPTESRTSSTPRSLLKDAIEAHIDPGNLASEAVARKLGFEVGDYAPGEGFELAREPGVKRRLRVWTTWRPTTSTTENPTTTSKHLPTTASAANNEDAENDAAALPAEMQGLDAEIQAATLADDAKRMSEEAEVAARSRIKYMASRLAESKKYSSSLDDWGKDGMR